jgi:3',5'-cyclic AMP phosphodiesterase CpdA
MKTFYLKSKTVSQKTRIVHISDSHLIVAEKSDETYFKKEKERKLFFEREALARTGEVHYAEEKLAEAIEYAKSADLTIFTGDIIEFPTLANVKKMMEHFSALDNYLYTFGNHDYMDYTLAESATEQYEKNISMFASELKNDLEIAVKEVNGIYVVTLDNSRFQFTQRQYDELKKLFDEGKEVILGMHIPLDTPALGIVGIQKVNQIAEACASEYNLASPNYPTETTKAVIELIKEKHEQVLALLVGHVHYDAVVPYYKNIVQYICLPTYLNDFYEFIIEKAE